MGVVSSNESEVCVVVVNFNSGPHLRNCITALPAALESMPADVVIVDNASSDLSVPAALEVTDVPLRLLSNHTNEGYGRACNAGASGTSAPLMCFLNPDTVPGPGSIKKLKKVFEGHPGAGIAGPKILNSDGTIYPSCRVVPSLKVALGHAVFGFIHPGNRFSRAYKMMDWVLDKTTRVDWVSGAAMMVRRDVFSEVGGFDEGFFMYAEDVDLCDRVRHAGFEVLYDPSPTMIHHSAGSSSRAPYRMIRHHHFSLIRYALKRTAGTPKVVLLPLIAVALLGRMVLAWINQVFTKLRKDR